VCSHQFPGAEPPGRERQAQARLGRRQDRVRGLDEVEVGLARRQCELVLLGRESRSIAGAGDLRRQVDRRLSVAAPSPRPDHRWRDQDGITLSQIPSQPFGFRLRRRERLP
jgi:hypothetical protein